jgi:ABC-type multidrug transport system ATPase subunit
MDRYKGIYIEGLSFGYPLCKVFDGFSWSAGKQISVIEGPSGCGKTTFLRILAGHLKNANYSAGNVPKLARIILQEDGLFPWLTAMGNLTLVTEWPGLEAIPSDLKDMAELIKPYAQQIVATLSFGQRRFLELFRVLSCPATLILLDEPLNFLDTMRRNLVLQSIQRLAAHGHNFVISSHYEQDYNQIECCRYQFIGDMPYQTLYSVEQT